MKFKSLIFIFPIKKHNKKETKSKKKKRESKPGSSGKQITYIAHT
jgi:hypothetical protein